MARSRVPIFALLLLGCVVLASAEGASAADLTGAATVKVRVDDASDEALLPSSESKPKVQYNIPCSYVILARPRMGLLYTD